MIKKLLALGLLVQVSSMYTVDPVSSTVSSADGSSIDYILQVGACVPILYTAYNVGKELLGSKKVPCVERLFLIPGIETAQKVTVTVNSDVFDCILKKDTNNLITWQYNFNNNIRTGSATDFYNAYINAFKDYISQFIHQIFIKNIKVKITACVDGAEYAVVPPFGEKITLDSSMTFSDAVNPIACYVCDVLQAPKHITLGMIDRAGLIPSGYAIIISKAKKQLSFGRKVSVAGLYAGLLAAGYHKTALASLGLLYSGSLQNETVREEVVTLTAQTQDELKALFAEWVKNNVAKQTDYYITFTKLCIRKINDQEFEYTFCIPYSQDNKAMPIKIDPDDQVAIANQITKEQRNAVPVHAQNNIIQNAQAACKQLKDWATNAEKHENKRRVARYWFDDFFRDIFNK